jgi:hypothetical protein
VGQPVLLDRVLERPRHVRLPDEIVERLRPIFSRENLIAHAPNLIRFNPRENRNQEFGQDNRIYWIEARKRDSSIGRWTLDVGRSTFSPSP